MKTGIEGCFPPGRIFRAQRNFSLFVSSQVELIEKRTSLPGGKPASTATRRQQSCFSVSQHIFGAL